MKMYKIYHKGDYLGRTYAKSESKAINNVRFSSGRMYAPMSEFIAKEVMPWDR